MVLNTFQIINKTGVREKKANMFGSFKEKKKH